MDKSIILQVVEIRIFMIKIFMIKITKKINCETQMATLLAIPILVIHILAIPKERPKNDFYPWGKKYYGLPGLLHFLLHTCVYRKGKDNARDDVNDTILPHHP